MLTVLSFGWSLFVLLFRILPTPFPILWWLYQFHRLQLESPSLSCSIGYQFHSFHLPSFYAVINQDGKVCFVLTITKSGRLEEIKWSVCISKSQRILCISFSRTDAGLYLHHLFTWSNLNIFHSSQWINLPYPVVSTLKLSLHGYATFAYYVIGCFFSITT